MILVSAGVWRYYAGYAGKVSGEAYPLDGDDTLKIVSVRATGMCAEWNPSHVLSTWKLARILDNNMFDVATMSTSIVHRKIYHHADFCREKKTNWTFVKNRQRQVVRPLKWPTVPQYPNYQSNLQRV